MPSLIMERGRQKLQNILEDGLGRDLMDAGRFCFSCEKIFANRRCLEEHMCSAASHICSCGTEFTEYKDMLEHSTTHEPGHQVLDHETIKKRRIEKRIEEEEQLRRLQTGEVVWQIPKSDNVSSVSLPGTPSLQVPIKSAHMLQAQMQSAQISQVPELCPSMSQDSHIQNPLSSSSDMKNIFARVGAPTVDLWTLYQPVVIVQTMRKFNKTKPYSCAKCGQVFVTKNSLISHHSSHVTDKVSGCIGCGLLLSSKKLVPRFHACNSPITATKFRIITARPYSGKDKSQNSSVGQPQAASFLHLKNLNVRAASQGGQEHHVTSTLQLKNWNMKAYSQMSQGLRVMPPVKSPNPRASKPHIAAPHPLMSQSLNRKALNVNSGRPPIASPRQIKRPASAAYSKPTATPPASGVPVKAMAAASASNEFTCRVCHIPFETAQLLQRHKCTKAQEFMAQNVRSGKQHYKLKSVTPVQRPNFGQMNGEQNLRVPISGNIRKKQVMAIGLDRGQRMLPVNRKTVIDMDDDDDDDCYIVESGPDKPAEMIYQVTSSVPIKT